MCLKRLIDFKVNKNYGWQIFERRRTGLVQLHRHHFQRHPTIVMEGAWQTDPNNYCIRPACGFSKYKTGFHILLEFEDALDYLIESNEEVIRKVWFKDVVATGEEDILFIDPVRSAKVVVAKKRFAEPENTEEEKDVLGRISRL